jgi:hypothetical protein
MAERCFIKKNSPPPGCGVHNVQFVEHQTYRESLAGGVGNFAYLVCPFSDQVPNDPTPKIQT